MDRKIHILYVDDETDLLHIGKLFLERTGDFLVTLAPGAAEAISLLKNDTFDVIISDYQMPKMDGIVFLKHLKSDGVPTPFILFTGRGREEVVIEALNNGAAFYLQKGGDPEAQFAELSNKIHSAVSNRRAEMDLIQKNEELQAAYEQISASEEELRTNYNELHRQEQLVRESEERFRGIFNSSLVGIATTDPGGKWLFFNHKLCDMLGYSQKELKEKTWADITPSENLEEEMILFRSVLAGKDPVNVEKQYLCKDGSRIDVIVSTGVVRNSDGAIEYFSSIIQDITKRKEAEKALTESEARMHVLIQTLPDSIWLKNSEGVYLSCNTVLERLLGMSEADIVGKTDYDFFDEEIANELREHDRNAVAAGKPTSNEEWVTFADDGHRALLETIKTPMYDDRGTLIGVLGIGRDITQRKITEIALNESEVLLRGLFDTMPSGAAIYSVQNDGSRGSDYIIADFNKASLLIEGKQKDEVVGRSLADLRPNIDDFGLIPIFQKVWKTGETVFFPAKIYVDDAYANWYENYVFRLPTGQIVSIYNDVTDAKHFQQVVETGKAIGELPFRHKDGSLRYWSVDAVRISPTRFMGFVQDTTGRRLVEESLRRSETKYRQVVEYANEAIVVAQEGVLVLVNPKTAELTGYPEEELWHKPFFSFIHPDDRAMVVDRYHRRMRGEEPPSRYSFRLLKKNGSTAWVVLSVVTIEWEGRPASLNFLIDITDKRQAEEALQGSNQKLRLLTGLTRHDILNQITTVHLLLDMALDSSNLSKIHEYISRARQAGEQIEKTIGFTREYEGFGTTSSGWQRICQIIESAKGEVSPGSVTVDNQIQKDLVVYADPIIRKVFSTLMENAIRHGGKIMKIRFSCSDQEGNLVIICEDEGVGVPLEEKGYIFDHGYGKHTGIGLFLAREIPSITGFSIRECGEPGAGARFEILVPNGKYRYHDKGI